jgi:radical SAM superfamily enzyme YgiQ (UPF0313 family)
MISIGIIVPSWHYFSNPYKLQPLWEMHFATLIDSYYCREKVNVDIIDLREARKNNIELNNIKDYIPHRDVYFSWINKTADYVEIESISKQLKKQYKDSLYIVGGTHIENIPDEAKIIFDSILIGPGETCLASFLDDFIKQDFKNVYKDDWRNSHFAKFPVIKRHYLQKQSIVNTELFEKYGYFLATSVIFSRGCNFACSYCPYNLPHNIQRKTNKQIEMEIDYLKQQYKIKAINIRDEICIPLKDKDAIPFLKTLKSCNIVWRGQTRIGASKRVLELAKKSGCVELALGVESVSQDVLNRINKRQTIEQVEECFNLCNIIGIKTKMCLILGLPNEPNNIVDLTKQFIDKISPDYVNISGFCPIPGSDIYKNYKKYDIEHIDKDWSKHSHLMFRFSDSESYGVPFKYKSNTRWGESFTREEIINNIKELQHFVQERNMVY